jgi:hypothetical protein
MFEERCRKLDHVGQAGGNETLVLCFADHNFFVIGKVK